MEPMTQALSAALIHFVWQGAIVGMLLWITLAALRSRSASARYVVSCAALVVLAALPVITAAMLSRKALPTNVRGSVAAIAASPRAPGVMAQTIASTWIGSGLQQTAWLAEVQMWALQVWSLGVLLFSVRLVWGGAHAFGLGRRGQPADESLVATVVRLARRMGIDRPVRVLISTRIDVPSVIGWLGPVILLPPATAMGLTPQQLEAVLAHELAHIRRHDYLVNILQMVAETLLFYHPVVWWTSKQIRRERELCCDDLAVRCCGDAVTYARALTSLEKLRVAAPSLAMGSAGGPLLYRIQRLLGATTREGPSRCLGILATCLALTFAALNVSWVRAQSPADARPAFEVASIKPNTSGDRPGPTWFRPGGEFTATNTTLRDLIETAYQIAPRKGFVTGGPSWLDSDRFDVAAKAAAGAIGPGELDRDRVDKTKLMLQTLLDERFTLRLRRETKPLPIYELVAARSGPKLTKTVEPDCSRPVSLCHRFQGGSGWGIDGHAVSMRDLTDFLTLFTDRVVRDKTGITGEFDIRTTGWSDPNRRPAAGDGVARRPEEVLDPSGPSVFTVLEEQLGLRLQATKGPVETFLIEHVERPSEN
jgi:uncharacterized protein (TIGR03435 family)